MKRIRDIKIRCEVCGRSYDENGNKGRININEFTTCECGGHDENRYFAANTCPECIGKVFNFVKKLVEGE